MRIHDVFAGLVLLMLACSSLSAQPEGGSYARIWEDEITLPTYLIGEDGKNPRFYFGRAYQGAQGRMYPYPSKEVLTDEKVEKTYTAINLENEFISVQILPEIGGKLFLAVDKSNGYDFIYRQTAVKPVLIGMTGAWISGGIEWNVFHHHRVTSFTPVDYAIQENNDGSVTAWVGEIEWRHRMKWRVGVTLHPGRSYIEATLIAHNRSPFTHSILYFANAGVHSNEDYQVIFPPSTEWMTQHAKREYAGWPIAHETYNGVDFTALGKELGTDGTDISLWKNNIKQISFFAYNYEDDWMVGYDHGKKAGTCIVGNHHIAPGKKFWTTGNGPRGRVWDAILTDNDGPELELMAGGFSDNEPDYSWLQTGETKKVTHYFYPLREMGDVKNANAEAALNLVIENGEALVELNTTSCHEDAKLLLKNGDEIIFEDILSICPDSNYRKKLDLPDGVQEDRLVLSLSTVEGKELISFSPKKTSPGAFPGYEYEGDPESGTRSTMPERVKRPERPEDIESNEMLYLAGMRMEQFYNPSVDPMPYYEEGLKRDPGDQRINTAMGILKLRKGMFKESGEHLKKAIERSSWNYTHPRDAESFYYMGLVNKMTGSLKEAYDAFYQSTWDRAFHTPGHYMMAEISSQRKDYDLALDHLNQAISTDAAHLKSLNLKASMFRNSGKPNEAGRLAWHVAANDLLDFWSRNEIYLSLIDIGNKENAELTMIGLRGLMRDEPNSYLELATDYGNCGLWDEAIQVTRRLIEMEIEGKSNYPLLYYYTAFAYDQLGDEENASKYYAQAEQMPPDHCFPYRLEMIDVLKSAMEHNPDDAMAPYYLGNLLYDHQPGVAMKFWKKSADLGGDFATLYRNLGMGYDRTFNDLEKSMDYYEKALESDPSDSRVLFELDVICRLAGIAPEKRLAVLQKHHDRVIESQWLVPIEREAELNVLMGQYNEALKMMEQHRFRRWEGGENVYTSYVDANLLTGVQYFVEGNHEKAMEYFVDAGKFPLSMEAAKPFASGRSSEVLCFQGMLFEAMGEKKKAKQAYESAASERLYGRMGSPWYYRAYALKKLGRKKEAEDIFNRLVSSGESSLKAIESTSDMSFFAKFGERNSNDFRRARAHYLIGLGKLGIDRTEEAKSNFEKAAELDSYHLWSRARLAGSEAIP